MDTLEAVLRPGLAPYQEAQAAARHRVERNAAIAAGGLTDEEQKLVLELHRLVDECGDNNGTVEKAEIEAACGDKRGKFFAKLDVDADGHVDPQEFLSFFENMSRQRGKKTVQGLLGQIQKGIDRMKAEMLAKKEKEGHDSEDDEEHDEEQNDE